LASFSVWSSALAITWTEIQSRRLKELNACDPELEAQFSSTSDRDRAYQKLERKLVKRERQRLKEFQEVNLRPELCRLESRLIDVAIRRGFAQVATPIIMSKGLLSKMSVGDDHPLAAQIYWLDRNKCLRPMLAPHLYFILKDLIRLSDKPVRIFEVGPCFRKETKGARHLNEFTMFNIVEMGLPKEERQGRIAELASIAAEAAGIHNYRLESHKSAVYGETIDVVAGEQQIEVGSAAMGPHRLDRAWRITETWVGIGFGLERLLMAAENNKNVAKVGRSLAYLDGVRLNI
jgi:phenylalanyl-tRNA synthetase alpha chain